MQNIKSSSMIIAVDFDGCLCEDKFPDIGASNMWLINNLRLHQRVGHKIILWTCRTGKKLEETIEWCERRKLVFDAVNDDVPDVKKHFPSSENRKIYADVYIDDKSVNYMCKEGKFYVPSINETFKIAKGLANKRQPGAHAKFTNYHQQENIKAMEKRRKLAFKKERAFDGSLCSSS